MKKLIILAAAFLMAVMATAQTAEVFKPYRQTALRLPSVPLLVNDPYFSIWSPYNELNAGNPTHWSPRQKPFEGLLRVDNCRICISACSCAKFDSMLRQSTLCSSADSSTDQQIGRAHV